MQKYDSKTKKEKGWKKGEKNHAPFLKTDKPKKKTRPALPFLKIENLAPFFLHSLGIARN